MHLLLLTFLSGCDLSGVVPPGSCPLVAAPPATACVSGLTQDDSGYWGLQEHSWTGTVTASGTGSWPSGCEVIMGGEVQASAWWVSVDTVDGERFVGIDTTGAAVPQVGDTISVTASYDPGEFDATDGAVEVRDAAGGLVAWVGVAGSVGDLRAPAEVTLSRGEEVCAEADSCGSWAGYALDAAAEGAAGSVGRAEVGVIGTFTVTNAGVLEQTSQSGCPDWYVASAAVGIAGG